jgi:hypothetical protein
MPVEATLYVELGQPWPLLRRLPSLARAVQSDSVEVTALVLEEDIYGDRYALAEDDATFLAAQAEGPVLLPSDVAEDDGRPATRFAGVLRVSFLRWLAAIARESRASMRLSYAHERGDWLYELAQWTFATRESLTLTSFDGNAAPQWQGYVERWNEAATAGEGFRPFAQLLRDRKL